MKHIKYYIIALLALPLMAACSEDDYMLLHLLEIQ